MGELPSFITDVPEASLNQNQINNSALRTQTTYIGTLQKNAAVRNSKVVLLTVPAGYVFEVSYMQMSCVLFSDSIRMEYGLGFDITTDFVDPLQAVILLKEKDHQTVSQSFPRGSLLINEGKKLSGAIFDIFSSTVARAQFILTGNLIKKSELYQKENILL